MATPSPKSQPITDLLESVFGRTTAIESDTCSFCGADASQPTFRDELSQREYSISGLCQSCQDSVFNSDEEEY